jgi:hypothetical protein
MGSPQRIAPPVEKQLAVIATTAADLKAQFCELEALRGRFREAQSSAGSTPGRPRCGKWRRARDQRPSPLFSRSGYPQATVNGSRSDRESELLGRRGRWLVSRTVQFRLHILERPPQSPKSGEFDRGHYERIEYARFETKKDPNRNDEAEIAQSETHRSGVVEGEEPTGPRLCRFTDATVGVRSVAQLRQQHKTPTLHDVGPYLPYFVISRRESRTTRSRSKASDWLAPAPCVISCGSTLKFFSMHISRSTSPSGRSAGGLIEAPL